MQRKKILFHFFHVSSKMTCTSHIDKLHLISHNGWTQSWTVAIILQQSYRTLHFRISYNRARWKGLIGLDALSSRTLFHGLPPAQQFDCSRPVKRVQSNFQQNRDSLSYLLDPCVAIGTTATIKGFQGGRNYSAQSHENGVQCESRG